MKQLEPVRCICGAEAIVCQPFGEGMFEVECGAWRKPGFEAGCWGGPQRKTRYAAVKAWNETMVIAAWYKRIGGNKGEAPIWHHLKWKR